MSNLWGREPALILALVQSGIALAVGFGLDLTGEQVALILAFTAALLGVVTRHEVYSPATVDHLTRG
jgi:hypothetical protein